MQSWGEQEKKKKSINSVGDLHNEKPFGMTAPAPSATTMVTLFDKHLTTVMNCLQNVVYVMMLLYFLETGMIFICFAAHTVSPEDSWKGLFYNMWFGALVLGMMLRFKDTLECIILFENAKRRNDARKDATTVVSVGKDGAQIKHLDYGSTAAAWPGVACFMAHKFVGKAEQKEEEAAKDASAHNEEDAKEATSPSSNTTTDDEIKPDAASASSSTRSNADTSDVLN